MSDAESKYLIDETPSLWKARALKAEQLVELFQNERDISHYPYGNEEHLKKYVDELTQVGSAYLAELIKLGCIEQNRRWQEQQDLSLKAAEAVWPALHAALRAQGRRVGLNDLGAPRLTDWANQPVVCLEGYYGKSPKTKREAERIALTVGDGGWATIGELWLWVGGGGPIVTRTLQKHGFLPGEPKYGYR